MKIKQFIRTQRNRQLSRYLENVNPVKLNAVAAGKLIKAFRNAARKVPAYKAILKNNGINSSEITDLKTFVENVPVITKNDFFVPFDSESWCRRGMFDKTRYFMSSSGNYAFGAETHNIKKSVQGVDFTLDYLFNTSRKKTFLINCVPMGVHIKTSLALAETSVRSDMVLTMARKIAPKFDQTIIVGDPHFIKKVIEEGVDAGIHWDRLNVSLICGQDWFPESFRQYIGHLINLDIYTDPGRLIMATMGMTELGLNIFHETFDTIRLRNEAQRNLQFKNEICSTDIMAAPFIFHYYPQKSYIEEYRHADGDTTFLFSVTDNKAVIPLFRYDSGDSGRLLSYDDFQETLNHCGLADMRPRLKLPLAMLSGRKNNFITTKDSKIFPEDIKLALYEDFETASKTTGYFRISLQDESPLIEIQMKPGIDCNNTIRTRVAGTILKYVNADLEVRCYPYRDYPYGMELSYEYKFHNI